MTHLSINFEVSCRCGKSKFLISGKPLTRFICHCNICQKIYKQNFADIVVFKKQSISLIESEFVEFKKYKWAPAVNRGICSSCCQPMVGFMQIVPFVSVAFVPAMHFKAIDIGLSPSLHTFYHRRIDNVHDDLPKISGYWASQAIMAKKILSNFYEF